MINNRQTGRRRGRGGQRPPNMGGSGGGQSGNRQDNRQRGNAAQLLEKYKSMARDSQLAGDRVQTEYYLQYADHYFRVLSESRSRFEEQNPRRQRDDEMDGEDGEEDFADSGDQENSGDDDRGERVTEASRHDGGRDRDRDGNREPNRNRERPRFNRDDRAATHSDDEQPRLPARMSGPVDSLPLDVLPPAIGRDESAVAEDEKPRPLRRRTRAARPASGDDDVAPAA